MVSRVSLSTQTLDELKAKLRSDVYTAMDAARAAAAIEQATVNNSEIICTIYDKFYNAIGDPQYSELSFNFPRNDIGAGKMIISRLDPLADIILTCNSATVPITIEVQNMLWSGRIKIAHDNFGDRDKGDYIECELEDDYAWLFKIVAWPDYLAPIQAQFPPRGVSIGPVISLLKHLLATQAFRLQTGMWDLVNNVLSLDFDWRNWFGNAFMQPNPHGESFLQYLFTMLRTPIYVLPTDTLFDTSEFTSINWRMDKVGAIFKQQVEANGLAVEVKLWRPGDPQPGNDPLLEKFPLRVPTICVDIKDRLGVIGPTGTFVDGILRELVDLEATVFGEVLSPFLNAKGEYAPDWINIAPALGINYVPSWAVFNADNPQSQLRGRLSHHTPECWRVIIGGHSPQWMNDLVDSTIRYVIDMITIVVGITGVPNNLFDGLFDNILLAFQLADNFDRRVAAGPYCYPEIFVPTTNAPYTIDGLLQLKRQMWKTRGYIAGQLYFRNGGQYEIGRDLFLGGMATIIRNGQIYTDFIDNIAITDTRGKRTEVFVQVGDGKMQQAPFVRLQKQIVSYEEMFNILTLGQSN